MTSDLNTYIEAAYVEHIRELSISPGFEISNIQTHMGSHWQYATDTVRRRCERDADYLAGLMRDYRAQQSRLCNKISRLRRFSTFLGLGNSTVLEHVVEYLNTTAKYLEIVYGAPTIKFDLTDTPAAMLERLGMLGDSPEINSLLQVLG